jgi:hypothetical protein
VTGADNRALKLNSDPIEAGFEIAFASQPDDLIGDLSLVKQKKRRDRADAVLGGHALVVVDVDLADLDAAIVFIREFVEDGRDHFARTAPLGPKIHKDGHGRLKHLSGEIFLR